MHTHRIATWILLLLSAAGAQASDESGHVPPTPPAKPMPDMPYHEMTELMGMDDTGLTASLLVDRLEWRNTAGGDAGTWDAFAWYGGDYNKLWLRTEGERVGGRTEDARVELLWDRIIARWWSLQAGARQDFGAGPPRTWAALGIQGLAPQWFDLEATFYVGEGGRTAARFQAEYELLFTQRLVLQPEFELNLYGKSDPARGLGSGLSDLELGVRLRYEFRREFAPYVGVVWSRAFGETADLRGAEGESANDTRLVAGLRLRF